MFFHSCFLFNSSPMHFHSRFLFIFFVLLLLFFPPGNSDLAGDKAALLALRASVRGTTLRWDSSQSDPCAWDGIRCDRDRLHVTHVHLPADGLAGQLPPNTIGNLTELRTLSLRLNSLSGRLPPDIDSCTKLRVIVLEGNQFSGELPATLFGLRNLVQLNLAGNRLSGEMSPEFNKLYRLKTLYLENNQFSGSIPELNLPHLIKFNISYNQFNGSIPRILRNMHSDSFYGNSLCGEPLQSCPSTGNKLSGAAIAGIVIGSVVGLVLILLVLVILCQKLSTGKAASVAMLPAKQSEFEILSGNPVAVTESCDSGNAVAGSGVADSGGEVGLVFFGSSARVFDIKELLVASAEVLGRGTFGTTYKAVLEGGHELVVKRLKNVRMSDREFRERVEELGEMVHANLFPLKAYYYGKDEKLLLYDYAPMTSLSALLHEATKLGWPPLNWEERSAIAIGAARGIEYLHSQGPRVSHGNIKSSNILLCKHHGARVADSGIAHLVSATSAPLCSGYLAPEVMDAHMVSQKTDVYSFGVLLLELLTGRSPANEELDAVELPKWVESVVQDKWIIDVFDPVLLRYQNIEEQMVRLLRLGVACSCRQPEKRPTMAEVTRQIEETCRLG